MRFKKILVTGSSAVLGSAFKRIAKDYPDNEFVFLTSRDCDLTNFEDTEECIIKHKPDAIIHLAAVSGGIGLSMKYPATMLRDNAMMGFSILEAARKQGVKKVILTLTTGMYPTNAPLPLTEVNIHDGAPHDNNYGSSFGKRILEPAVRAYREEYGMNVIGLIPSGIFGENDNFNYDDAPMLPSLIRRFYENRNTDSPIEIWGDGKPLREYTYASDMARIYMWALENYDDGQCINIGTTEENTIADIAYMIADELGVDRNRVVFNTNKPNGIYRKNTNNELFVKASGWKYVSFKEGLRNTLKWFNDTYQNDRESIRLYSKVKTSQTNEARQ